jgi:hypothetical protein
LHPSKLYRLQELNEIVVDKRFITQPNFYDRLCF